MLKHIPSFYCLHYLANRPWSRQDDARRELTRLASHMAAAFRDYLFMACLGEARHGLRKTGCGFEGFEDRSRDSVFKEALNYAPSHANLDQLITLFDNGEWSDSYGGRKWAEIARKVKRYGELSDVLFVDMIVNSQHNGGLAFNKTEAALYLDFRFDTDQSTLTTYLDYRQKATALLSETALYLREYSLTTGVLVMDYLDESGEASSFCTRAQSIPDGVYRRAEWGDADLPPLIERGVTRCARCGYAVDYSYHCPECSEIFCEDCWSDGDDGMCESCAEGQTKCDECDSNGADNWCKHCHRYFCDECWSQGNLGICAECYKKRYQHACENCGDYFDNGDMYTCTNCDGWYCKECWDGTDDLCAICHQEQADEEDENEEDQEDQEEITPEQEQDDDKYRKLIDHYVYTQAAVS